MASDGIVMFLCGDVMTGRGIDQVLPHPSNPRLQESYATSAIDYVALAETAHGSISRPVEFGYIWGDAQEVFAREQPDVHIANLETAITTSEDCALKGVNYRMHPDNVPCLTAAGIDCCVLANNHVLDWGEAGLLETLETLAAAGLNATGAGSTVAKAKSPAILDVPGKGRVVVLGFGSVTSGIPRAWAASDRRPGVRLLRDLSDENIARVAEDVAAVRQPGDIVVASVHWGGNWGYEVPVTQRQFAHALIDDAGVDVIHGHSSHHAKGIEVYRDKPILYGCGDFITDYEGIRGKEAFRGDLSLMYFLTISPRSRKLLRLEMTPLKIRNFRLQHAAKKDVTWLQKMLDRESEKLGSRVMLKDTNNLSLAWD